jgi:hypothetical protein
VHLPLSACHCVTAYVYQLIHSGVRPFRKLAALLGRSPTLSIVRSLALTYGFQEDLVRDGQLPGSSARNGRFADMASKQFEEEPMWRPNVT